MPRELEIKPERLKPGTYLRLLGRGQDELVCLVRHGGQQRRGWIWVEGYNGNSWRRRDLILGTATEDEFNAYCAEMKASKANVESAKAAAPLPGLPDSTPEPEPTPKNPAVPIGQLADRQDGAVDSAPSFARETSAGPLGDVSSFDDQTLLESMEAECAAIRLLDANYPGRYHRLGALILESTKRLGEEQVRLTLRAQGINRTGAYYAKEIARLYTYEQAVAFPSFRAIVRSLPPKQPRKPKADPQAGPLHVLPEPPAEETLLDRFVQLGIKVKELLGDEALDRAVETIKTRAAETFEELFAEV